MFNAKPVIAGIMLLLTWSQQGCGRKGPLYMPQVPAKPVATLESPIVQRPAVSSPVIQSQPEATIQP